MSAAADPIGSVIHTDPVHTASGNVDSVIYCLYLRQLLLHRNLQFLTFTKGSASMLQDPCQIRIGNQRLWVTVTIFRDLKG